MYAAVNLNMTKNHEGELKIMERKIMRMILGPKK